jgi:hypothetical protein
LLQAVNKLVFHVSKYLPQLLDLICAAIEHVLQISKQPFFII